MKLLLIQIHQPSGFRGFLLSVIIVFSAQSWGQAGEGTQSGPAFGSKQAANCTSLGSYCGIEECRNNPILRGSCTAFGSRIKDDEVARELKKRGSFFDVPPPVISGDGGGAALGAAVTEPVPQAPSGKPGSASSKKDTKNEPGPSTTDELLRPSGVNEQALAQCEVAADEAAVACGSQSGGGFGSYSGGISAYGNALAGASGGALNANIQAAVNCTSQWRNCAYQCGDVAPHLAGQCEAYANVVSQMGQQAQHAYQAQEQAFNSGNKSASAPVSQAKPLENCNFNPTSAQCLALETARRQELGQSGFEDGRKPNPEFNINGNDGVRTQYNAAVTGNSEDLQNGNPGLKNSTVPNNSGGQVPGESAQTPAQLGARRGASSGSPGFSTDVMQGFQGGSVAGANASPGTNVKSKVKSHGYSQTRNPTGNGVGFDLKKYLPGGTAQNGRNLGGYIPFSNEINGPNVNIWSRISDRFMEKCRLGELLDCR